MKHFLLFKTVILSALLSCAQEKKNDIPIDSDPKNYTTEVVVPDLQIPWGMVWLPDGSMLITEKKGELIHYKDGVKTNVENVPAVYNRNQGGLLDIELHPKYSENGWLYITYSSKEGSEKGGHTALIRAQLKNNQLTSIEPLYKGSPNTTRGHHFGSRIEFDNDGYVYFSIGDRGNRDGNPQDITKDGGKIYRLQDDGSIPKDNPFINDTSSKKAIFSYGHRNPQGMAIHPSTGKIWVHEHGPRGGDEINIIKKGINYGWPVITYGINYSGSSITDMTHKEGMEQPIYYWVPSIAPSGMDFVTSDKYPDWKNDLLVGSLKFQYLELVELDNNKVIGRKKIVDGIGRVRNVRQGPDGYIYVAVENKGIIKIIPN
ncbi:PQQ-dependent sugar dehydrogenase [Aquimarina litoralis]|uniref:PQQ-dependent sugar dehydrogenase n=1 Tax=Aquimarina litoralis TaxID=584605 RepID=UPI001C5826E0|nr:PQQ-dependent sugar dehydrogenase [Aquimarina litoralis]MBW1294498.1 PQQ-dependent sugar dehydrogenase [Aquimarina litoralis]